VDIASINASKVPQASLRTRNDRSL